VILSQKEGRFEKVVAYASKSLTEAQKKFHPMEGECYALIWGIMHFRQYLHKNHFILRTDHKPLEWLATVSDAHGRRGRWVDMLQDFSFKIIHRPNLRHTNVDALNRNPVGPAMDDGDFCEEIQDIRGAQTDAPMEEGEFLFVWSGKKTKWIGIRRKNRESVQHHACCFGINHYNHVNSHHLYMVDVVSEEDQPQKPIPCEAENRKGGEVMQDSIARVVLKRKRPHYYDKQQQLELALAAQQLFESGEHDLVPTGSNEEDEWGATQDTKTYGRMYPAWIYCRKACYQTLLIMWKLGGQGRE